MANGVPDWPKHSRALNTYHLVHHSNAPELGHQIAGMMLV